ncbi:hypothetical protein N9349_05265 [Candidatus Pelagibacter sp.]|nr:hypothetical protein [Candidatus Pelagibacter sp.]
MDQFREEENNPFDAPIPGQGLTDKPGNYPWEHPPQYTNTADAADAVWDKLTNPEFTEQVIAMLDSGIPVEAIGRIILFSGFSEGKWNPDVAFVIAEPIMKMIASIGIQGGVKKFRISIQDLTNKKEMKSILDVKKNKEEFEKAAMGATKSLEKPMAQGLMAPPPQPETEEMI